MPGISRHHHNTYLILYRDRQGKRHAMSFDATTALDAQRLAHQQLAKEDFMRIDSILVYEAGDSAHRPAS